MFLCFSNSWLLLNPSPLCADWTMGTIPLIQSVADPRNLLTLATFIILFIIGLYCMSGSSRDQQAVLFAMLLIVFPFLPASNLLFPVGFVVAERILYVPSMGVSILVALGAHRLGRTHSKLIANLAKLGMAYLLVCHTLKTLERNRDWHSDMTLFTSAVHTNPHNGKIYNNLGHAYELVKNYSYAEKMYRNAAAKQPDDVGSYINLGRVLKAQMRYTEAEEVGSDVVMVTSWNLTRFVTCIPQYCLSHPPGLPEGSGSHSQGENLQNSSRAHQCLLQPG